MDNQERTLADRLRLLIDAKTEKRGKFAQLETLTNISAENWKSFYYNRQRPNPDMIEALGQLWPEFAFWLVTGITDFAHGHISPTSTDKWVRTAAKDYFVAEIKLQKWEALHPNYEDDDAERIEQLKLQVESHQKYEVRREQEITLNKVAKEERLKEYDEAIKKGDIPF